MGTRSTIALEFADRTVEQVYCHWDGYLENNGAILEQHYKDPFKVKELVGLGGFSSLKDTVEDTAVEAYTQRGDSLDINRFATIAEYVQLAQREEYDYILRNVNGQPEWFVRFYATGDEWVMLSAAVGVDQHSDVD